MAQVFRNTVRNYFTSGSEFSNSFNPRDIQGLKLWLSPDGYANTFEIIGAGVSNWADKSINSNLLTYSEQFDNAAWSLPAGLNAATPNTVTAPDGTMTADTINEDATTGFHYFVQQATAPSGTYTASIYVRPNVRNWIYLSVDGGATGSNFDVLNGVIGTTDGANTPSISPEANGYYRCSITKSGVTNPTCEVFVETGNNGYSYTGTNSASLYVWGGQIQRAHRAGAYAQTVATAITSNDVAQTQSSNYPVYNTNQLNSIPTVSFSDTNGTYLFNSNRTDLAPSTITFTTVARYTTSQSISFIGGRGDTGSAGYWIGYLSTNVPTGKIGAGGGEVRPTSGAENINIWGVYTLVATDASANLFRNGVSGAGEGTGDVIDYTGTPDFILGQTTGLVAGRGLTGDIAETVMYGYVLSTINQRRLEKYLGRKYAITVA